MEDGTMIAESGMNEGARGELRLAPLVSVCAATLLCCVGHGNAALDDLGIDAHGFADARGGVRTHDDPNQKDMSLGETRLQLDLRRMGNISTLQVRADLLYDDVPENHAFNLEDGAGPIDLREANVLVSPLNSLDVKAGRQILTWGTGDLLFINDLFPKDWQSFLIGRDEEYLKAPSDAVLVGFFSELANMDIAYTPRFDSDRYINGDRLSYWNPILNATSGRNAVIVPEKPNEWFDDGEIATRISKSVAGYDLAVYAYDGYWKTPVGMNPSKMESFFPCLAVYGGSAQGGLGKGIFNVEAGYYNSKNDSGGNDPFIPNSEARVLLGYERELARDFSLGAQYYLEHLQNYKEYISALPQGWNAAGRDRQVGTIRLTKLAFNQNLTLSVFAYYSPTDNDAYLRPAIRYKATDSWLLTAGGNVFNGKDEHTFFGQFHENSNVYAGVRHSF